MKEKKMKRDTNEEEREKREIEAETRKVRELVENNTGTCHAQPLSRTR